MQKDIQDILDEIYSIEPNLEKNDEKLQKIVQHLLDLKPQVNIDETFKQSLRSDIMAAIWKQKIANLEQKNNVSFFKFFGTIFAGWAIAAFGIFFYGDHLQAPFQEPLSQEDAPQIAMLKSIPTWGNESLADTQESYSEENTAWDTSMSTTEKRSYEDTKTSISKSNNERNITPPSTPETSSQNTDPITDEPSTASDALVFSDDTMSTMSLDMMPASNDINMFSVFPLYSFQWDFELNLPKSMNVYKEKNDISTDFSLPKDVSSMTFQDESEIPQEKYEIQSYDILSQEEVIYIAEKWGISWWWEENFKGTKELQNPKLTYISSQNWEEIYLIPAITFAIKDTSGEMILIPLPKDMYTLESDGSLSWQK